MVDILSLDREHKKAHQGIHRLASHMYPYSVEGISWLKVAVSFRSNALGATNADSTGVLATMART